MLWKGYIKLRGTFVVAGVTLDMLQRDVHRMRVLLRSCTFYRAWSRCFLAGKGLIFVCSTLTPHILPLWRLDGVWRGLVTEDLF